MATIAERIKQIRKSNGLTQTEFGNLFEIVKSTVSSYETGNSVPDDKTKIAICKHFNVSMDYLVGTADLPQLTEYDPTFFNLPKNIRPIRTQSFPKFGGTGMTDSGRGTEAESGASGSKKFPVLGKIACNQPFYAFESCEAYVEASSSIQADFCLIAQGDSMTGARILDGDTVFIRAQQSVENGQIAAVLIGDEATLKRWNYYPEKSQLVLTPENPAYAPLVYVGDELNAVRCLGLAVCFMSKL